MPIPISTLPAAPPGLRAIDPVILLAHAPTVPVVVADGSSTLLVAAPDLTSVSSLIFTLLGSIIMAVVGVRMFTAYAKRNWGELITELVAVVFVGWFIWFPDSAKATLTVIIHQVFG